MPKLLTGSLKDESVSAIESGGLEHLNLICASKAFELSATLKSLLVYLFQHRNDLISEYSIAVEALNRKPDFDPQIDATVRVQISRLRKRLKDFYLSEGAHTDMRFTVPLGSHQLILEGTSNALASANNLVIARFAEPYSARAAQADSASPFGSVRLTVILGLLVLVLAAVCAWQYRQLKSPARLAALTPTPQLLPFWKDFYANGRPVQIVLPNPIFFHWYGPNDGDLMVRDTSINSFMNIDESPELAALEQKFGRPTLVQSYAVSSDIVASLQLLHYLDLRNVNTTTSISTDTSSDKFEQENVVLMGTTETLMQFKNQIDRLYFRFQAQSHDTIVANPHPLPSELAEYKAIQESQIRLIHPGIISLIPGNSKGSHILILQGLQTAALVSFLTSNAGCQQLKDARNRAGASPFFEAIIMSEMDGDIALNSHLAAFRAFNPKAAQN